MPPAFDLSLRYETGPRDSALPGRFRGLSLRGIMGRCARSVDATRGWSAADFRQTVNGARVRGQRALLAYDMTRFSIPRAFVVGFCLGVGTSTVMVLSQSVQVWWTPLWQEILLFPGIHLGSAFYDCCRTWFPASWDLWPALFVGIVSVGLWYGIVCCGLFLLLRQLSSRRRRMCDRARKSGGPSPAA